jgi:hemolysin activation/secretion protein
LISQLLIKEDAVKRLISKTMLLVQVFVLVTFCPIAWSQTTIPDEAKPGAVQKSLEAPPASPQAPLPEIVVEEDERGFLKGGEGVKFLLKDVTFADNWIFSPEDLKELIRSYLGKNIDVAELANVTGVITKYYKSKGYFLSRAYIPPQTIKDGIVMIRVREGRLGEVIINGNKRFRRDLIRNTLKVIRGEGAVRTADVERALLLLMDYPGLTVKATFKPGERPGTSDIVIDVTEAPVVAGSCDYNNFGSRFVSRDRFGVAASANNLAGRGDALSIRGVFGGEGISKMAYSRLDYIMPLGYSGSRLGMHLHKMHYELVGDLAATEGKGNSEGIGLWYSYPIVRSRNLNWFVDFGFDLKNVSQDILGQQVGKDKVRAASAGTTVQWTDDYNGSNTFNIKGYTGFAGMLGGMDQTYTDTIRQKTDVVFNKLEGQFSRIQSIPYGFVGLFDIRGQYSQYRLPSSEQLSLGGVGTVRGYSASEFSGDSGYSATAELRIPIFGMRDWRWFGKGKTVGETLQLAAFYDWGALQITEALPAEYFQDKISMAGIGVGLRFTYSPHLSFKVDWAKSVGGENPRDDSVKDSGIWYFQAVASF